MVLLLCRWTEADVPGWFINSAKFVVHFSVPQGLVLGDLKFVTYTENPSAVIQCFAIEHHLYANDTLLSNELPITSIAASISNIEHWFDAVGALRSCSN